MTPSAAQPFRNRENASGEQCLLFAPRTIKYKNKVTDTLYGMVITLFFFCLYFRIRCCADRYRRALFRFGRLRVTAGALAHTGLGERNRTVIGGCSELCVHGSLGHVAVARVCGVYGYLSERREQLIFTFGPTRDNESDIALCGVQVGFPDVDGILKCDIALARIRGYRNACIRF